MQPGLGGTRPDGPEQSLDDLPNVKKGFGNVALRPAARCGDAGAEFQSAMPRMSDEDRKRLFNLRDKDFGTSSR